MFRRVRVSGAINLRALHDKVIAPAMGWVSDCFDSFVRACVLVCSIVAVLVVRFVLLFRPGGAVFGPDDSKLEAIDMMRVCNIFSATTSIDWLICFNTPQNSLSLHIFMKIFQLHQASQFLSIFFRLGYLYVLGDDWSHCIEVEEILERSESNGQVTVWKVKECVHRKTAMVWKTKASGLHLRLASELNLCFHIEMC